jgi:hypothetical protein
LVGPSGHRVGSDALARREPTALHRDG